MFDSRVAGAHGFDGSLHVSLAQRVHRPNESWDDKPLGDDGGHLHGCFPAGVTPGDATSRRASEARSSRTLHLRAGTAGWGGDHHDGVPTYICSRHEPRIDITAGRS